MSTVFPPKPLNEKLADYHSESFATWLEKTNIVAREEGDLTTLDADIRSQLDEGSYAYSLVNVINVVYDQTMKELRNVLIKSIGMS